MSDAKEIILQFPKPSISTVVKLSKPFPLILIIAPPVAI